MTAEAMQLPGYERHKDKFTITTNKRRLELDVIHNFLTQSYWSPGISKEKVSQAIENSLCFGIFFQDQQIGFARIISDYTTFAYLADVFVLETFRGQGLAKWLLECILAHPNLQGLRRWLLATKDAHGLYAQSGFKPLHSPDAFMEVHNPDVYKTVKEK